MSTQTTKTNISPDALSDSQDSDSDELERQVERGSFFTHTAIGRNSMRIGEVESYLYGVVDLLMAKGQLASDELTSSIENVRQELTARGDVPNAGVALRIDAPEESQGTEVKVNCTERMPVCHGVCCKLDFALTHDEVETGKVKWDLGRPYYIRHGKNGFCVHNNRKTGGCGCYQDRPGICRTYSCAKDTRIWKDFEKMELNHEWLTENLNQPSSVQMAAALMQNIEINTAEKFDEDPPSKVNKK